MSIRMHEIHALGVRIIPKRGEYGDEGPIAIKVQHASPLDVPLLMHMVEDGARLSLFSPSYLEFVEILRLWQRATRASRIFRRRVSTFSAGQEILLRASVDGETVGLLLAQTQADGSMFIHIVTVDRVWRRRHVGRTLVNAAIRATSPGAVITASCAPAAKEMIGLLGRMGFRISKVARPISGGVVLPFYLQLVKNPS